MGPWGGEQGLGASTLSGPGSPEPVPEDEPVLKTPAGAPLPCPGPGLAEGPRVCSPHWARQQRPREPAWASYTQEAARLPPRRRAAQRAGEGTFSPVPFPLCVTCGWSCARISWGAPSPAGSPESRRELCRTPPPGAGNTTSFGNSVFAGVNEDGGFDEAQGGGWSDAATGQGFPGPPGSGGEGQGLWRGRGPGTPGRQTSDLQPVALSHPAGGPCSGSPETDAQQSAGEGAEAQGSSSRSQLGRELGRRSLSPA